MKKKQEKQPLTVRQKRVYTTILQYMAENGHYPTYRHLMVLLRIGGPNGVRGHILPLHKKGWIRLRDCSHGEGVSTKMEIPCITRAIQGAAKSALHNPIPVVREGPGVRKHEANGTGRHALV